jgi:hypothetical protein
MHTFYISNITNKKFNAEGKVDKYKHWLVEKGYSQVEGIDFGKKQSLVSKLTSIIFIYLLLFLLILK